MQIIIQQFLLQLEYFTGKTQLTPCEQEFYTHFRPSNVQALSFHNRDPCFFRFHIHFMIVPKTMMEQTKDTSCLIG